MGSFLGRLGLRILPAVALLITSCGHGDARDEPAATPRLVAGDLARVGIAVFADPSHAEPVEAIVGPWSPISLLADQVAFLDNEVTAGGGFTGEELDSLVELPPGAPPFSYLPAAWLARASTPAAELARALMGDDELRDWSRPRTILFPTAVLILFVSDIAGEAPSVVASSLLPANPSRGPVLAMALPFVGAANAQVGVCSGLTGWVNYILERLFQALKLEDSFLPSILEDVWNWAVDLAQGVVQGLVSILKMPISVIEGALKTGIAVVGALSLFTSLLGDWAVRVKFNPAKSHSPHSGSSSLVGTATAVVKGAGSSSTQKWIWDCAKDAGVTLPKPGPSGKKVTWKLPDATALRTLVAETHRSNVVDDRNRAVLEFQILPEAPEDSDEPSQVHTGIQYVFVEVERLSPSEVQELLASLVFNGPAGAVLKKVLGGAASKVSGQLAALASKVKDYNYAYIDYHFPASDEKQPTEPTPTGPPPIAADCPYGEWESFEFVVPGYAVLEGGTGVDLTIEPDGSGVIDFDDSTPVVYFFPEAEPPTMTKVEVRGRVTFTWVDEKATGVWKVTSATGGQSVQASINVGGGFIEVGGDQIGGAFGDLGGAWISCNGDGSLDWNNAGAVSWYSFKACGG